MSLEENKNLIRRYSQAIDENQTSDWSILDEYIAEDFVAHNPLHPGVSLDREGMKQGAELLSCRGSGRPPRDRDAGRGGRPRRQPDRGPRRARRGVACPAKAGSLGAIGASLGDRLLPLRLGVRTVSEGAAIRRSSVE